VEQIEDTPSKIPCKSDSLRMNSETQWIHWVISMQRRGPYDTFVRMRVEHATG